MKKTLLLLSFALCIQQATSQCSQAAVNFGNNTNIPMYNIGSNNGQPADVEIVLNDDNTITLDIGANFVTAPGPDVRAFLINSEGYTDSQIQAIANGNVPGVTVQGLEKIEFGLVGSLSGFGNPIVNINGAKSLTVDLPEGTSIENFDKLLFYCELFSQFWDVGSIAPFSTDNCDLLSVAESELNTIAIYPNPATDLVQVSGQVSDLAEVQIINTLGKVVYEKVGGISQGINVSGINTGMYIFMLNDNGKRTTRKLVVQ